MRVSDLQFTDEIAVNVMFFGWRGHSVETTSDAHCTLSNPESAKQYIKQYGDQEIEYDEKCKVYRVPAFAERIARYSKLKQIDCDRWGCE